MLDDSRFKKFQKGMQQLARGAALATAIALLAGAAAAQSLSTASTGASAAPGATAMPGFSLVLGDYPLLSADLLLSFDAPLRFDLAGSRVTVDGQTHAWADYFSEIEADALVLTTPAPGSLAVSVIPLRTPLLTTQVLLQPSLAIAAGTPVGSLLSVHLGGSLAQDVAANTEDPLDLQATITVVPEPATWLLWAAGLSGLLLARRRRP